MKEIWKKINNYPDYEISNLGNVKSFRRKYKDGKGKIMKKCLDGSGYEYVKLHKTKEEFKYIHVHRLVAENFIPNPENKPQVNHIDGIKTHNYIENLEWNTIEENIQHAFKTGLGSIKEAQQSCYKPCGKFDLKTDELIESYISLKDMGEKNGYTRKMVEIVSRCCRGLKESYKGYKWHFIDKD